MVVKFTRAKSRMVNESDTRQISSGVYITSNQRHDTLDTRQISCGGHDTDTRQISEVVMKSTHVKSVAVVMKSTHVK